MMTFFVEGQKIIHDPIHVVADTYNYLEAKVEFLTSEWLGLTDIWLHFRCGLSVFEVLLVDGKVTADNQVNLTAGDWVVYLHGVIRDGI